MASVSASSEDCPNDAEHVRDLGVVRADVAFDEGVVVLELAQGRTGVLAHDLGTSESDVHAARRGAPLSFCLRVSKPVLLAPSAPALPVSPECSRAVVWEPERLRALRLRQRPEPLLPPGA